MADQQLKAAKEEIKSLECLRAEASGAADKARTDLAALEVQLQPHHPLPAVTCIAPLA